MTKSTLFAVIVGLGILGCDSNSRTAMTDRPTSPAQSPATPSAGTPSRTASSPGATHTDATDQALAQRVTSALREDSALAPVVPNITVEANDGTVTLNGSVSTQQRSAIESKVRGITGVTQVVNNLQIASASR